MNNPNLQSAQQRAPQKPVPAAPVRPEWLDKLIKWGSTILPGAAGPVVAPIRKYLPVNPSVIGGPIARPIHQLQDRRLLDQEVVRPEGLPQQPKPLSAEMGVQMPESNRVQSGDQVNYPIDNLIYYPDSVYPGKVNLPHYLDTADPKLLKKNYPSILPNNQLIDSIPENIKKEATSVEGLLRPARKQFNKNKVLV